MNRRYEIVLFLSPFGSILLGLPYIAHLFGSTEQEVALWGIVSVGIGIGMAILVLALHDQAAWLTKFVLNTGYLLIVLLQVLPIQLWWRFHGRGIGDGTPASWFVAHWLFAVPHLLLLVAALFAIGVSLTVRRVQT